MGCVDCNANTLPPQFYTSTILSVGSHYFLQKIINTFYSTSKGFKAIQCDKSLEAIYSATFMSNSICFSLTKLHTKNQKVYWLPIFISCCNFLLGASCNYFID